MDPKTNHMLGVLARVHQRLAAEGGDHFLKQLEALLSGSKTQWESIRDSLLQVTFSPGFTEARFPLEEKVTAEGVDEVGFPSKCKTGTQALAQLKLKKALVGPGSAMLYVAEHRCNKEKLVFTGCEYHSESDCHHYVVVYDPAERSIGLELVDDISTGYKFLVR